MNSFNLKLVKLSKPTRLPIQLIKTSKKVISRKILEILKRKRAIRFKLKTGKFKLVAQKVISHVSSSASQKSKIRCWSLNHQDPNQIVLAKMTKETQVLKF